MEAMLIWHQAKHLDCDIDNNGDVDAVVHVFLHFRCLMLGSCLGMTVVLRHTAQSTRRSEQEFSLSASVIVPIMSQ
jgi:hypothetical protein